MSIVIQRQGEQERPQEPTIKLNKSLLLACEELERIGDSLCNDTRIKATALGVNAINREFETNIDLHAIRKLKFDKFKNNFDRQISAQLVGYELKYLAEKVRAGTAIFQHIGDLADVESALKMNITSHLHSKTSLVKHMRQNKLKFKDGYSLNEPHKLYWGKREQYQMHFFFPFQYRPMTTTEIEREAKQAIKVRKAAAKKALQTKKQNAIIEKKRLKSADVIIKKIAASVDDYLLNSDPNTPLFLDTETTGLNRKDKVIEIAIIDLNNTVVIDTLLYTKTAINRDAYNVHYISKSDIANMPKFSEIESHIARLIEERKLYIFNADFDLYMMKNSATDNFKTEASSIECLMNIAGDRLNNGYRISLGNACESVGVKCGGHRAVSDTLASINLYKALIAKIEDKELA
ncbi:3'-5' exonuclease [Psychrobacter sp. M13]|uniref:3'-5' exonuclease n=1 Tax=Psychrobacter sp. M13 TaxID=3067275 RepID=UPI00273B7BF9|nr:3'-5' exonuclease [Psychrobacter sp. M13]WLP95930.1 3'-5' exonuclease [Psychrobacter sp. M13]